MAKSDSSDPTPTRQDLVVVVEIDENGGNAHHVLPAARHAVWRRGDEDVDLLALVRAEGLEFDSWAEACAHVAAQGGSVVDVIAIEGDREED